MPQGLPDAGAEKSADPVPVFLASDVPGLRHLRRLLALGQELCTQVADRFAAQSCGARLAADAAELLARQPTPPVLARPAGLARPGPLAASAGDSPALPEAAAASAEVAQAP